MTGGSKLLLHLLVGILAVFVLLVLFAMGPLGWFAIGFLALGGMAVMAYIEGGEDRTATTTNCAACGAPNDADRETCQYCGDPL